MRAMLLSDLRLALPHLLDERGAVLESTVAGRLYGPRLATLWATIAILPGPVAERRPLSDAIAEADARHDAYGAAIWYYTEAVLRTPEATASDRAAARRLREAFVPQLSILQHSYASEAAQARRNRGRITEHAADLARFPVPGESSSLAAWVEGFVSSGEALGELLVARSDQRAPEGTRGDAARLRAQVLGLLTRLRTTLADELADNPVDLRVRDTELFGFIDQLAARREESRRRRSSMAANDTDATPSVDQIHEAAAVS